MLLGCLSGLFIRLTNCENKGKAPTLIQLTSYISMSITQIWARKLEKPRLNGNYTPFSTVFKTDNVILWLTARTRLPHLIGMVNDSLCFCRLIWCNDSLLFQTEHHYLFPHFLDILRLIWMIVSMVRCCIYSFSNERSIDIICNIGLKPLEAELSGVFCSSLNLYF